MLRRCPAHGPFDEAYCPTSGHRGDELLEEEHRTRLSTFCSGALRHFPEDVGLDLDRAGWTPLADLIEAARDRCAWARVDHVRAVLATDRKGRFERDGDRVRATYGHSVEVAIEKDEGSVPGQLYHGTTRERWAAIREEGLTPQGRREVHLSPAAAQAREVGLRHGDGIVVLRIDVNGVRKHGIDVHRRSSAVFTCERVPPEHLSLVDE
ncbi:RNA 2'-phosphotransferase [Thermoplasmatales archaeon SW_10_69_26]|nr:MAG: RNA 2'-phosphotransferase [Thermoplasmatales archaeon SW_10_69_26]